MYYFEVYNIYIPYNIYIYIYAIQPQITDHRVRHVKKWYGMGGQLSHLSFKRWMTQSIYRPFDVLSATDIVSSQE